ncbi:MAG: hypothetical protein NWE92_10930 [Candidatus Bathyarchaeota archaeon]|nr:hypothetical protein [Candidatus Bathyarchaeota archaeon]
MKKFSISRPLILRLLLIVAVVVLIANIVALTRDYQDSWILEGLEIPFLAFAIIFLIAFFSEREEGWLVAIASIGRVVFLSVPILKYVWFQGVYQDQSFQYNLANTVITTGHIAPFSSSIAPDYSGAPLFHLLFSAFSIILNVPVVDAMKYIPLLLAPLYPLFTYLIVKKLALPSGESVTKFALLLSSIPFSIVQYEITGSTIGLLLVLIIFYTFISLIKGNDRRYLLLAFFFAVALAAAHSASSILLSLILITFLIVQRFPFNALQRLNLKSCFRNNIIFITIAITCAWLLFMSYPALTNVLRTFFVGVPSGTTPSSESISPTFYTLLEHDFFGAVRTFSVYYGAVLVLLVLTLFGLLLLLKERKKLNDRARFIIVVGILLVVFIFLGVVLKFGPTRALAFESLLFPIFVGFFIAKFYKKRKWLSGLFVILIMFTAVIQVYSCQPLIASANSVYPDLSSEVPIGYANAVNSVYQRQIANFAITHFSSGRIAADLNTHEQLLQVANYSFVAEHLVKYYPLDPTAPYMAYSVLMVHTPGKAGIIDELAPYRTTDIILETVYNSSVVYTNGESYMLLGHAKG